MNEKTWIYQFWNSQFYINKVTGSLFTKKMDQNEFHEIVKEKMNEILDYYKWVNLLYQPVTIQVYRAFKNWQLSKFKNLLIA